jgi:hypothetical protein
MTPNQDRPALPKVHPEVYDRLNEVTRVLSEAPMPFTRHQALAGSVRGVLQYIEGLEGKVAKLEEELAAAKTTPMPTPAE